MYTVLSYNEFNNLVVLGNWISMQRLIYSIYRWNVTILFSFSCNFVVEINGLNSKTIRLQALQTMYLWSESRVIYLFMPLYMNYFKYIIYCALWVYVWLKQHSFLIIKLKAIINLSKPVGKATHLKKVRTCYNDKMAKSYAICIHGWSVYVAPPL